MPPYKKATSKAQQRKFFELAREGKMSMTDAKGKAQKGSRFERMPEHVKPKKKAKR